MKTCTKCKKEQPLTEFHRSGKYLKSWCRACTAKQTKEWRANREDTKNRYSVNRQYHLQKKYGITTKQYDDLLKKQNHRCYICEKHEKEFKTKLSVDHNHITGEIRGLLCNYCNRRLVGRHRDGDLLRKIADYIEQGTGLFVPKQPRKRKKKR